MIAFDKAAKRWSVAWLVMALLLAIHVLDEALTGFLPRYNATVVSLRETLGWFPFPVFTFASWISGLIAGVLLVLLLALVARAGRRWLLMLAYPFGAIMVLNGLGHLGLSVYLREWFPGVMSSVLLLPGSIWFLVATRRFHRAA
ncbi:MAG: HXXEE domain-containing protein [Xanthomonadales bacterium]|nr:HXXEE domain-containing protein [Xanthomonadales bacterium]